MVCIVSSTGEIIIVALFDFAIKIPIGAPKSKHKNVATEMIASVDMVSFHIPNKPIITKAKTVPATKVNFFDAFHVKKAITAITKGQGELIRSFSNQTKNCNKGSKKFSIPSPCVLENSLKELSIPFLKSRRVSRPKEGNLNKLSII